MPHSEKTSKSISPIFYPQPFWRYALLFQSWSQLGSWLLIVLLTTLSIYSFLGGLKESPPLAGLLLGVAFGSLTSVVMVVPAQFRIASNNVESIKNVLLALENMRYVESYRILDVVVYRQKLPRFLRWREGEVRVRRNPEGIVIDGPRSILGMVRAKLMNAI
ncbi:hypothetical protein IV454_14215 [Massilia antarctica]|uniref:PH domain-containing protein n=1 Tax=Massilia antarctica TaxID=2765360 RepID=A0AA48WIZ8_9BURK|nr:hypothetical protein [Massilia antarctica]QPI52537.1 hypothetical protein IV454_14215 [Massilia antarctica]